MQKLSTIAIEIPTDLQLFNVKDSRGNVLVLREPIALDYGLMDEMKDGLSSQERIFQMALRLAVSFNGEKGVTLANIASLSRDGYKELMNIIIGFQLDIVPDRAESFVKDYLNNTGDLA